MIENEPMVYDLPVTPLFGGYNSITSNYLIIKIDCAFDARTARHASIPNAIENKAILSVCGKLYKEQATNNRKKHNQDLLNFEDKCKNKKINKKAEQTLIAESTNNKLNYEDPINRLNNESKDKIENKPNSEYNKQQNKAEKISIQELIN
ncbi:41588_t:CDS:2 [Gigaspora margarita]|uniref:41588_t:CDS:1 n=1 Tax=Gigaspora margarita TaxID=4874 RepID=A0ABN7WS61_GIGMA|nr:41588_t:CDS:2 [Gigaspora margarita]